MAENIRAIALETLIEIFENGTYTTKILPAVLDKYSYLDKQDRAFLTRLVTGTSERMLTEDAVLNAYSKTAVRKMRPVIRTALRMAVYQMLYMDSVPDSAAVNESVKLVKKKHMANLSGFVNGVLRSISRDHQAGTLKGLTSDDPVKSLSIKYSVPEWIVKSFINDYSSKKAALILENLYIKRPLTARVNTERTAADELLDRLNLSGVSARGLDLSQEYPDGYNDPSDGRLSGECILIDRLDSLGETESFAQGLFFIQDLSSQEAVHAAGIKDGDTVLDVCAAPGGKSLSAALAASGVRVLSRDISEKKTDLIRENVSRIRLNDSTVTVETHDALDFDANLEGKMDVVIADLPCSGLGVLSKKPEIRYRLKSTDIDELSELQQRIMNIVCHYVKPGGTMLYSTCTVTKKENQDNVKRFLDSNPEFSSDDTGTQIFPDKLHDGFFYAVLRRKKI